MSSITIGTNISSLTAQRRLSDSSGQLQNIFQRLASGRRINTASDDAAGLSIASSLDFSTRVYSKAINNINDGISALSIASGALSSLSNIVQRQMELAEQAANGTFSRTQRLTMQQEANALANEFNRIIGTAEFNGVNLLGSSSDMRLQLGYGSDSFLDIGLGKKINRAVGTGTFSALSGATIAVGSQDTTVADLNGDGNMDMIAATNGGYINVKYGNGDGTFGGVVTITTNGARHVAVGDVNGDGKMDIIHSGGTGFNVVLQDSSGGFSAPVSYTGAYGFTDARDGTLADVNGDGQLDYIVRYGTTTGVEVFLGNGNGSFSSSAGFAGTNTIGLPSVGDVNGDGTLDFVLGGNFGSGNGAYIFYGNGNGKFKAPVNLGTSGGVNLTVLADFNNDGLLDVVQASGASGVQVRLGNGDGTFKGIQTTSDIGVNTVQGQLKVIDLNQDGYADVVGLNWSNGNIVSYFGNGDGTFRASTSTYVGATGALGLQFGDFDGDGVLDALTSAGGSTFVLKSDTRLSAQQGQIYLATQAGARSSLDALRVTLERIQQETSSLGSSLSRLGFGLNAIAARREGELASYSRIMDADIGQDSSELTRLKILQQVSSAVLAQANIQPQIALKLLQG